MINLMLLKRASTNDHSDSVIDKFLKDYNRLTLLENAVLNYSGGISELQKRVDYQLHEYAISEKGKKNDESLEKLIVDISLYLRDISLHLKA